MKPFKPKPKGLLAALMLAGALLLAPSTASACSCFPPSVTSSYQNADEVFAGSVIFKAIVDVTAWHVVRVRGSFKGCLEKKDWVIVKTSAFGSACGAYLEQGKTYLLFGSDIASTWPVPVVHINSCDANRYVSAVTAAQRKWLLGRTRCCDNQCSCAGGGFMVNCFVDPCMFAVCPSGTCQANYCGGCNAEFYTDNGHQVCNPCASDEDCDWNLQCVAQTGGGALCLESSLCGDLANVNFGDCEMVLGWGVISGECQLVSGCGDQGLTLFDSQSECVEACGPGLF